MSRHLDTLLQKFPRLQKIREDLATSAPMSIHEIVQSGRQSENSKPIVLCLQRPIFDADISQLQTYSSIFNFCPIPFSAYTKFMRGHPFDSFEQTHFLRQAEAYPQIFAPAVHIWDEAFKRLRRTRQIAAILTANLDYFQDQPVRLSAKKNEIPVIALQKEHPLSEGSIRRTNARYRRYPYPDQGMFMLMGGEMSTIYVDLNMVSRERTYLTGFPRFDAYMQRISRSRNSLTKDEPAILILDFSTRYSGEQAEPLFQYALSLFPSATIKAREPEDEFRLRNYAPNRTIVSGEFHSHVRQFDVVIGYQSTALIEAMLAGTFVIGLYEANTDNFSLPHRPDLGIHSFSSHDFLQSSPRSLQAQIQEFKLTPELIEERLRLAQHYFLVDEVPSTHRVESAISQIAGA